MIDIDLLLESDGIFRTQFDEQSFAYRLLTLREYKVLNGLRASGVLPEFSVYIKAFERCYIGSSKLWNRNLPLGIFVSIGQLIMYLSGDCELETLPTDLVVARELYPAASVQERMKQVIWMAFPSYKIEDIDKCTRPELIRKFIIAEHVLVGRGTGYQLLDPSELKTIDELQETNVPSGVVDPSQLDFSREAESQNSATGFWDKVDALEDVVKKEKRGLTPEQARKLDRIKSAGR